MKKILWLTAIILTGTLTAFAQTPICPKISIIGPSGLTKPGDSMTFSVNLRGGNFDNLTYKWSVSKREIIDGQGTSSIIIPTTSEMIGETITATVEVDGLPQGGSKTGRQGRSIRVVDSYFLVRLMNTDAFRGLMRKFGLRMEF